MIKYSPSVSVLRQIRRELNRIIPKAKDAPNGIDKSIEHMLDLFRSSSGDSQQGLHAYLAKSYLAYLRSSRLQDELTSKYFHKAERSVEQSARLVGLSLPKQRADQHPAASSTCLRDG